MLENEERVINILNKIDILISTIDKLNAKKRISAKISHNLGIDDYQCIEINDDELKNMSLYIKENYELKNDIYNELVDLEKTLEVDFEFIKNAIETQVKCIEENSLSQIYKKGKKLIYVARWQKTQRERKYYLSKNNLIDTFLGKSKLKKVMAKNKELEGELIKKEYSEIKDIYEGQSIREIVNVLNSFPDKNNELIEFQSEIIKLYMLDKNSLNSKPNISWEMANLVPTGFFEKRKYYKFLTKKIEEENKNMMNLLKNKSNIVNKTLNKFDKLANMNKNLGIIINNL